LTKVAHAAEQESDDFLVGSEDDLYKQTVVTQMGGRNYITGSNQFNSGSDYLRAIEETAAKQSSFKGA